MTCTAPLIDTAVPYSVATEFELPDDLGDPFEPLVRRHLLDIARSEEAHSCLLAGMDVQAITSTAVEEVRTVDVVSPLLLTSDGQVIGGLFQRDDDPATGLILSLPPAVPGRRDWVEAMIELLEGIDGTRFPARDPWELQAEWRTPSENAAQEEIDGIGAERRDALVALEKMEAEARQRLAEATRDAGIGIRRLMTASGSGLVEAVLQSLRELEFIVQDMDTLRPQDDLLEDVQVRVAHNDDWVALAEVRAYERAGANTADLLRLTGRFAKRFIRETGREPSALWYIVNQFWSRSPNERLRQRSLRKGDVEAFAVDHGLVIDTTQLYRLILAVRADRLSTTDARRSLVEATGEFTLRE